MEWAERFQLFTTPELRDRASAAEYGRIPVYGYPGAPAEQTYTAARFMMSWFLLDDSIEGVGAGARTESILNGLRQLEDLLPTAPRCADWRTLGMLLAEGMSLAWVERNADVFAAWIGSVRDEAALFRCHGPTPPLRAYLDVRSHTVGMDVSSALGEYAYRREVPTRLQHDPHKGEAARLIGLLQTIDNDLHGLTKDHKAGWHNAVFALAAEHNTTWAAACAKLLALRDAWLSRLLEVEAQVCDRYGDPAEQWFTDQHHLMTGLLLWQHQVGRYQRTHQTPDGETITLHVKGTRT
ncbi:hypothetical protein [Kitasatospora sp. NPDC057223]|uniref:terpene synthase family protein n=1 Tax=Kitasatospora sp. NPDC057223 TaxID=3346055 RepID=UPI0036416B9F